MSAWWSTSVPVPTPTRSRARLNNALLNQRLQQALGYTFVRSDLLTQALTHRSYGALNTERLELLGDSVLICSFARSFYYSFLELPYVSLSRLLANLLRQETQTNKTVTLKLGESLR